MMTRVNVKVESDADAYAVWIDKQGVRLIDGVGGRDLPPGEHYITWIILGAPGKKAKVTLSKAGAAIKTMNSVIAAGKQHEADVDYFDA